MPAPVSIQVGGNVDGSIVVGDNNFVVNTNHGTIVYKQAGPRVRMRQFAPQPPRPPREFVNRAAELVKLESWISASEIVLLHGPDGMGKSSLLKRAANSAAAQAMPNGVVLLESVDLDGQALGPDDVIQNLFDALFESDPQLKVDSVSARTYLSNTRPLVLLDEISLSPALQKALPDLFPRGAILVTADLPFGAYFERLPVGPLPRQEAVNLLAVKADVTLHESNRVVLDAICASLNDVSLAVVIIGNILRETHTPPEATLQALQNIPVSTADPVSAALNRSFSFAFSQLSPEEQKILSAAALTPGVSMSPEWLSAALGGMDVEAFVERLKALGLLFANSPRLRLPPGFRAPARRAAVLDEDALLPRLLEFLTAPLQQNPQDWEYIRAELGNFFGVLIWAVRTRRWADVIALGRILDPYVSLHGLWDTWNSALGYVLDAARQSGDQSVEAWALHQSGVREIGVGAYRQALNFLKQALELRQAQGDTVGMAYTQHNIDFLMGLPPTGHDGPKSPKSPGGGINPLLLAGGLAVAALIGLALLAVGAGFLLFPSTPTPTPHVSLPPGLTATQFVPLTETPTTVPTPTSTPMPTPLGGSGQLVFQSLPDEFKEDYFLLYTLSAGSFDAQELFRNLPARQSAWSPNGKYLAFVADGKSPAIDISYRAQSLNYRQIYSAQADGFNIQQLTNSAGNKSHPTWSPDGRYIAFVVEDSELGSDIYVMDADGNHLKNLTLGIKESVDYPEWSPDGSRIAYQAFSNGNWEIFVMTASGFKPQQLTRASGNHESEWSIQPSWSPDARRIVFASSRSGSWDIYIMDDHGAEVKALTQDSFYDVFPDWSPDGLLIAFSSNRDGGSLQIYMMNADGSGITLLTKMPADASEADWQPGMPGTGQ